MSREQWMEAAKERGLKEGVPVAVKAGKANVLIVRAGGRICACGHECTHYGGPLSDGLLVGHVITCPWHNARFDVRDGKMVSPPALDGVISYPVKVESGAVFIGPGKPPAPPTIGSGDDRTFVIVGAGAAGNACAETLRQEGFGGRILLITAEADGPYDRPALSKDFMAGELSRRALPLRKPDFYEGRRIELLTGRRVTEFDARARTVSFTDGGSVKFDCALLATGGMPRKADIPGADLAGFFLLRSLHDAEAITDAVAEAERVVILGAGFIGMEAASSLRSRGLEVHVVAPGRAPMEKVFGEQIGSWLQQRHEENGVRFYLGNVAKAVNGKGKVQEVLLADGTRIVTDAVVAGLGIVPAVDYIRDAGLVENGAVPVNGRLQTKADGVYAAGDIAVVPDRHTGEPQRVEHWVVAERQGQHAARAMLGSDAVYSAVPFFWTRQFGTSVKYAGFARQYDKLAVRGGIEDGDFLAGYYSSGRLKAISGVGRAQEFIALCEILKAGGTVSPEELQDEGVDLREVMARA
jgi:NADPH-dependent 2,4-dienoyl-CoA reductase/sulfur reductase-like enzyme/nitrite reductase/ring-hydroxylating ferredoxin subunit